MLHICKAGRWLLYYYLWNTFSFALCRACIVSSLKPEFLPRCATLMVISYWYTVLHIIVSSFSITLMGADHLDLVAEWWLLWIWYCVDMSRIDWHFRAFTAVVVFEFLFGIWKAGRWLRYYYLWNTCSFFTEVRIHIQVYNFNGH